MTQRSERHESFILLGGVERKWWASKQPTLRSAGNFNDAGHITAALDPEMM